MDLIELYKFAENSGIIIDCFDLQTQECLSIMDGNCDCYIAVNPFALTSSADEKVKLAHEIGHCESRAFYDQNTPLYIREKYEHLAIKWAIKKLVPKDELINLYKDGTCENSQVADYFGVTEDFLQKALKYYCTNTI